MRAAWILKEEYGYDTRIINMHTLKPMDDMAVIHAAHETGVIITAEEHQIGALAGRVSQIITSTPRLYGVPIITGAIGVKDRFGESSAEHICRKACELLNVKQQVIQEEAVTAEL
jgi:transketolase